MKTTILKKAVIGILILSSYRGESQSNPTPFNLETGGTYSFTNWSATSAASTYPNNMIFHILANTNPTLTSVASGNATGVYNDASTKTRMNGLGTGGFSFRNSSTTPDLTGYTSNRLGEAVLAVNTTNRTNVKVSFKAGEIGSASPIYAITCQYRIGTSGGYLSLPGASSLWEYRSDNASSSISFAPINLPAACDNQSIVQLRWVYNFISGTTSGKPQLFIDDISVTSIPFVSISPLPNTCINNPSFLLTDGQPAGGLYSGVGVIGNNFDPSVSGSGIQTITYTYTDGNGFSNFAATTIDVNSSYCVTTTTLTPSFCGATGLSKNNYIYCEPVFGATDYEFQFVNTGLGFTQSGFRGTGLANLNLLAVSGLRYGQTYDVKVKAKVADVWGAFSTSCPITLMSFPSTNLNSTSCGATGLSLSSYISCYAVAGASDYEFTISNLSLGYSQIKIRAVYSAIYLSSYTGLQYGQAYNVSVRAKVAGIWGPIGSSCTITLMAFPSTNLSSASCGVTGLSMSSYISCNPIAGASDYEFTISNSSLGYSQVRSRVAYSAIYLSSYAGLIYGQTYDVSVRAKVSGVWSPIGLSCPITLMAFPSTNLNNTSCGATNLALTNYIYCNPIAGASDYEFTISNSSLGYSQVRTRTLYPAIILNSFTGLFPSTTYDITVRAKVTGVWGPAGSVCSITLSSTPGLFMPNTDELRQMEFANSDLKNPLIKIYPNPISMNNQLSVDLTENQSVTVILSDVMGRHIFEKNYSDVNLFKISLSELQMGAGLYNLSVINGSNIQNQKLIITK